jgi:AraC-like DNA-binding protein
MKRGNSKTLTFDTISELMRGLGLDPPMHPLIALVNYDTQNVDLISAGSWFLLNFYKISFKENFNGSVRYGPGNYDFTEGGLAFLAPNQLVEMSADPDDYTGYALYFHMDLFRQYPLARQIQLYGFFSYTVSEALFLSEKEKNVISSLFGSIEAELANNIDPFSQDVLVSQIELLLNHSNRFYNRQFITRKASNHDLIDRMNTYLSESFDSGSILNKGLPSPSDIADQLQVSQRYLSDMLRSLTGKTTQQHIHLWLIEKAKVLLSQDLLTTAEIAYQLGFEHPQSFNKLFKQKTNLSPASFRQKIYPN